MQNTIIFDWAEYEREVAESIGLRYRDADFEPAPFSLEKARNYRKISISIDSAISDGAIRELAAAGTQLIAIRTAGYDMLNASLATSLGIKLSRVSAYSPESIAEHGFALLLYLVRRLAVQNHQHESMLNIRTTASLGHTLTGKTLGIYGMGHIGVKSAMIARGFGMRIAYLDRGVSEFGQVRARDLAELAAMSDFLFVHVPLTEETRYSINSEVLSAAKPGMYLINVARGDIVDPDAVIAALDSGQLAGFGADVWDSGKVDDKFELRLLRDNVIQTHHVAFFTREAVGKILRETEKNLSGRPDPENIIQG